MPEPHVHLSYPGLAGSERLLASFPGGSVVQVVAGSPAGGEATVVAVHPARVMLTSERLVAADGDLEWSWPLSDIDAVHPGGTEPWTIVEVPGVPDHGVAVSDHDVHRFRSSLERLLEGPAPPSERPPPRVEVEGEPRPPGPDETSAPPAGPAVDAAAAEPVVDLTEFPPSDPDFVTVADLDSDTTQLDLLPPPPAGYDEVREPAESQGPRMTGRRARVLRRDRREADPLAQLPLAGLESGSPAAGVLPLAGLEAREISAWFGTHHVLDRVSLMMAPGLVTALIGPSGCGKSTFLRILNRMHEMVPSASLSGEVLLDGEDIYDAQKKLTDARRQIGMVFQKPNPFPAMSIYDNVVAAFRLTGTRIPSAEKDEVVESCLTKAGLWTEVRDRLRSPGGGLSGGQQQRLCIARALAIRPRVLLMDEPCSALDPTSTRRIEETIMELGSEVTIVIVTHNMQQAARVSNQCAFFLAEQGTPGVIVEHGETEAMFESPQDPRTFDYVNGRFG